jgi:hypothetical protein
MYTLCSQPYKTGYTKLREQLVSSAHSFVELNALLQDSASYSYRRDSTGFFLEIAIE